MRRFVTTASPPAYCFRMIRLARWYWRDGVRGPARHPRRKRQRRHGSDPGCLQATDPSIPPGAKTLPGEIGNALPRNSIRMRGEHGMAADKSCERPRDTARIKHANQAGSRAGVRLPYRDRLGRPGWATAKAIAAPLMPARARRSSASTSIRCGQRKPARKFAPSARRMAGECAVMRATSRKENQVPAAIAACRAPRGDRRASSTMSASS